MLSKDDGILSCRTVHELGCREPVVRLGNRLFQCRFVVGVNRHGLCPEI